MIIAALLSLQLVNTPTADEDARQRRITPEVLVVQKVAPTVVYITTRGIQKVQDIFGRVFNQEREGGSGSGVVITSDGYIVTNYHVIDFANQSGSSGAIQVTFDATYGDEQIYQAELISVEPTEDLALLKIEREQPFDAIVMGSSDDLMIAERVLAFGNPYGHTHTVSRGIISGLHRQVSVSQTQQFSELIQTDAAINPGNSGGPLVNINGELIGINTVMNVKAQNIGFAIPVDKIHRVLQEKLLSPSIARAWLGFDVDLASLQIENVLVGSPAEDAGLKKGDTITQIGGKAVSNEEEYKFARVELASDQDVEIAVNRDGRAQTFRMKAWNRIRGLFYSRLGLEVENYRFSTGYNRYYDAIRVTGVREAGPGAELELQIGDIITTVTPDEQRSYRIQSEAALALLINQLLPDTSIEIEVWRDLNEDQIFERNADYSELYQGRLTLR